MHRLARTILPLSRNPYARVISSTSQFRPIVAEKPTVLQTAISGMVNTVAAPLQVFGSGLLPVPPNSVALGTQFGKYTGLKYTSGLNWTPVPMGQKFHTVFMGERTTSMQDLKIIDAHGNPLQVSGIMNYRVEVPEQFAFGVSEPEIYIYHQAESTLKTNVSKFTYDQLRSQDGELENALVTDITDRLKVTGVTVSEFRLTDINYAKEIAGAMLVKQQAIAYNDAKKEIVETASDMIDSVVNSDSYKSMDPTIRDQLKKDLMIILTSGSNVQPVINVG